MAGDLQPSRVPGLVISAMNAYYVFLKFAKLWELQQRADRQQSPFSNQHSAIDKG